MLKLGQLVFVLVFSLLISACSKTAGSHTTDERKRLAKLHSQLSFEFMFNNNISVAQGEAEEALRLDPTGIEPNHAMARVQQLLNNESELIRHYEQALTTDPYSVIVLNDYGQYLCSQGRVKEALAKFDRAGSQLMNSHRMVSYTRAAACAISNQEFDLAEQYLLRALELNSDSKPVLLNLTRVSVEKRDYNMANRYLDHYMKIESKPSPQALKLATQIQSKI